MLSWRVSGNSGIDLNSLPIRHLLPMQAVQNIDAGFTTQPAMPFFSKSTPMSVALNALGQPMPMRNAPRRACNSCIDSQVVDLIGGVPNSAGVATLLAAFRITGGVARGDELAMMLEDLKMGNVASLGRALASGEVCSFQWRSAFWIPMFQFDLDNLAFKHGPRKILRELAGVFDGWTLTAWFAQPNTWLNGRKPVDLLGTNLPAVFEAARADRYVAVG